MAKGHRTQIKRRRNEQKDTRPKAHGRFLRISDIKARIVLEQIKGKSVAEAAAVLKFSPRSAAALILKILKSAVANAENNMGLDADALYVEDAYANRGSSYGSRFRLRPRAKGRGYRIERKVSHISVVLNERRPKAK
jgi:large subunit ribosomal protein L22